MENTLYKFDTALSQLHTWLSPLPINWMIIGTASLYLSGLAVTPNDIDILSTIENACLIEQKLLAYKLESDVLTDKKFRSRFSKYKIAGIEIELMGGLEINTHNGWSPVSDLISSPQKIIHQDKNFVIPGKGDQLKIYTTFNREKDGKILSLLQA